MAVTVTAQWSSISYIKNFSYTGAAQTWTVPYTGNYKVELWGASGGNYTTAYQGGKGGYVTGDISLSSGDSFYFYIGQQPTTQSGGFNGGGNGQTTSNAGNGYAGGGASDMRTASGTWNNATSLRSRIMVAGGGGGTSYYNSDGNLVGTNGHGGGITGVDGSYLVIRNSSGGTTSGWGSYWRYLSGNGGTQTSGGAAPVAPGYVSGVAGGFGYGGASTNCYMGNSSCSGSNLAGAAGGGGGWYGGSSSGRNSHAAGGGSSYISGIIGFVGVNSSGTALCSSGDSIACATSHTGYKFSSGSTIAGNASMPNTAGTGNETGHTGNGYARITYLGN